MYTLKCTYNHRQNHIDLKIYEIEFRNNEIFFKKKNLNEIFF